MNTAITKHQPTDETIKPFHRGRLFKKKQYKGIEYEQILFIHNGGKAEQSFNCAFLGMKNLKDETYYNFEGKDISEIFRQLTQKEVILIHSKIDDILEKNRIVDDLLIHQFESYTEILLEEKISLKDKIKCFFDKPSFLWFLLILILFYAFLGYFFPAN